MTNEQEVGIPDEKVIINADFTLDTLNQIWHMVKNEGGVEKTRGRLVNQFSFHPTFVNAILKKIMRERGW